MGSKLKDSLFSHHIAWNRLSIGMCVLVVIALSGCANFSTTVFRYKSSDGGSVSIEMPKEVEAKDLHVSINAKTGTATITAKQWSSKNSETINAEAKREAQILDKASGLVEAGSEGAVRGAVKGLVPIP